VKLKIRKKMSEKVKSRLKKKIRLRKKSYGTVERPRLTIFKSSRHTYAQVIDDVTGKTLLEASTLSVKADKSSGSRDAARRIGAEIAKKAQEKNIQTVVFDRNGFLYHGRIKELADGAREAGLKF
jgi:large subunit ribosomal protein L18